MSVAFRRESNEEYVGLKFAVPIPPRHNLVTAHGKVLIDARVTALEQAGAAAIDEAATEPGRLSSTAPLARALMGAEPGDLLPFGGREDAIAILAVPTEPLP